MNIRYIKTGFIKAILVLVLFVFMGFFTGNNLYNYKHLLLIQTPDIEEGAMVIIYENTQSAKSVKEVRNISNGVSGFSFYADEYIKIKEQYTFPLTDNIKIAHSGKLKDLKEVKEISTPLQGEPEINYQQLNLCGGVFLLLLIVILFSDKVKFWKFLTAYLCVFCLIFIISIRCYIATYFADYNAQEIIFVVLTPFSGANSTDIHNFMRMCIVVPALITLGILVAPKILHWLYYRFLRYVRKNFYNYLVLSSTCLIFIISGYYAYSSKIFTYIFSPKGTFYSENYIEPSKELLKFPEQKRNLILIQLESIEKSFGDKDIYTLSLIEDLENYEKNGIVFADYNDGYGTTPTQPSLIASFTGMPSIKLNYKILNTTEQHIAPFQKVYSLGKILNDAGYQMFSVRGSNGTFSGTNMFLEAHGVQYNVDLSLLARRYFHKNIPTYSWGYHDDEVFEAAKDILKNNSSPFFMLIQTLDSHASIYRTDVENKFDNHFYNTIHHTSKITADFLKWIREQDFADNTTIIVYGDHLRKENDILYPRKRQIYNLFINAAKTPLNLNRSFSQIDLFPTFLEAIGIEVKGHRLGLGTSVFSELPTLAERYAPEVLQEELSKSDDLYNSLL